MKILVVDDAKTNRFIIVQYILRFDPTIEVQEASNGEEAIKKAIDETVFDIIFMDIKMPGKYNGIKASEIIRNKYPNQIIYGLTGQVENRTSNFMNIIIQKPTSKTEIFNILKSFKQEI